MENSPTEQVAVTPASNETTGQGQQQISAEQNQETNSREQSQGSVSDDTAQTTQTQTQQNGGGENQTDDGLAKFAKSQGVEDVSQLSARELQFLKIAHDNQKAFREKTNQPSIADESKNLGGTDDYDTVAEKFFSENRDRSLEPKMLEVLAQKREQYGDDYARNLLQDLDGLYTLAQSSPAQAPVDAEAIRREERESINRQMSATAPTSHATQGQRESTSTVDENWIRTEYDPRNPEHRALVDEYYSR